MSELKIYKQSDILWGHWFTEYCRKDEADKVITEKDKLIAELKEIDSKNRSAYYKDLAMMAKDVEHHKYKRCLAMAKMCEERYHYLTCLENYQLTDKEYQQVICDYWDRWYKRWLKIAEKFKEAK